MNAAETPKLSYTKCTTKFSDETIIDSVEKIENEMRLLEIALPIDRKNIEETL